MKGLEHLKLHISPPRGTEYGKKFSHYRIKSENRFRDIKIYRACKEMMRITTDNEEKLLNTHNKIWTIAAAFTNMIFA